MMKTADIMTLLKKHQVNYQTITAKTEAKNAVSCQTNLFKDQASHFFLIMQPKKKQLDSQKVQENLHCSVLLKAKPHELREKLQSEPETLSPFALLNDASNQIPLVIDQAAIEANEHVLIPFKMQAISIKWLELSRFLGSYGHLVEEESLTKKQI